MPWHGSSIFVRPDAAAFNNKFICHFWTLSRVGLTLNIFSFRLLCSHIFKFPFNFQDISISLTCRQVSRSLAIWSRKFAVVFLLHILQQITSRVDPANVESIVSLFFYPLRGILRHTTQVKKGDETLISKDLQKLENAYFLLLANTSCLAIAVFTLGIPITRTIFNLLFQLGNKPIICILYFVHKHSSINARTGDVEEAKKRREKKQQQNVNTK